MVLWKVESSDEGLRVEQNSERGWGMSLEAVTLNLIYCKCPVPHFALHGKEGMV